ncbi:MAG: hypothetical protein LAP21_21210 [Acidobacteriia bacterium]|nr:hypothetical protein [Terriglobia bacterium]
MSTEFAERIFDCAIAGFDGDYPKVRLLGSGSAPLKDEKALRCMVSLMGETSPESCRLSPTFDFANDSRIYRFDWTFGLSFLNGHEWDWQSDLREENSVAVHLLISSGNSGFGFSEISSALLALQPSRNSKSWLESHGSQLTNALSCAGESAANLPAIGTGLSAILGMSSALSSFVTSGDDGGKNWFLYRFLDPEKQCCAIEWQINKKVLLQFGPALRGSLVLAFHGVPGAGEKGISMQVRTQLGFRNDNPICMVAPTRALPEDQQIRLLIRPRAEVTPQLPRTVASPQLGKLEAIRVLPEGSTVPAADTVRPLEKAGKGTL